MAMDIFAFGWLIGVLCCALYVKLLLGVIPMSNITKADLERLRREIQKDRETEWLKHSAKACLNAYCKV